MTWIAAIALALAAFAVAALVLRLPRVTWTALLAALALGLAGYAWQASPDQPGAPKPMRAAAAQGEWPLVEERKALIDPGRASNSPLVLTADGYARRGRFEESAALLRSALQRQPTDAEAWLALANVLVEHADGNLTRPALLAFRRAAEADPRSVAPGYFLGVALLRQGRFGEGREVWQRTLQEAPADAFGRARMQDRADGLDRLLQQIIEQRAQEQGQGAPLNAPGRAPQ